MPIEFSCSSCGAKLRVPDGTSGKKAKCPTCEAPNIVPDVAAGQPVELTSQPKPSIEFPCSSCGAKLRVPGGSAGKKAKCPTCQAVNVVPGAAPIRSPQSTPSMPPKPDGAASMPSPLDDPFGLQDEDLLRNMESHDWDADDFTESDNPFQAPHDFDGVRGPTVPVTNTITPTRLYFGQAIKETFRSFFNNIVTYLITSVLMILSYGVVFAIMSMGMFVMFPQMFRPDADLETMSVGAIFMFFPFTLLIMIICGLLGTGFLSCFIEIAKNGKTSFGDFFRGIKKFLPCFGYWIILWLVNFGLGILQQVATGVVMIGGNGNDAGIRLLVMGLIVILFAILNFWINFRLMWGFWLIIDQNYSVGHSLRITREISSRNALTGFVIFLALGFLVGLWFLLIVLISSAVMGLGDAFSVLGAVMLGVLCVLSGLLTIPFFAGLYTIMYLLMSGQHPSVRQADTEW